VSSPLQRPGTLLANHVAVVGAYVWTVLDFGFGPVGTGIAGVGVIPLLVGVRGLHRGSRYTRQWLAIAIVFYFGLGLAETVAAQARSVGAAALLVGSALELLLLLLALSGARPAPHESAES
jgi:uncharacterized membrane protein